ncbi:polysaccharide pyruvyl transferase family protein [Alkalicoccobacillus murimartini]|uniref:Polysaccharide pyruvyl transferase domain-containing protein n=1 Tax=Alkalicoccobacillus murimartini TaxID=171685 RepID=A0ABT9YGN5_9BACI|nr:polysaccharide pyruvyl transferase family protein [Alkalicoccobacillus murimartini]MDQ0206990.1 hypothetical protein [Alkalicoccobacillus murimartini]
MKKINLYYKKLPNMGDLLNPLIVDELFGMKSRHNIFLTCEMSGIGSGLESFLLSDKRKKRVAQKLTAPFFKDVHIWGTGFLRENINESYFYRKNTVFHAVRGELSKQKVERILGVKLDIPTGDAGLLASNLINYKVNKKFSLGIIPHFREQDSKVFSDIYKDNKNAKIIDLKEDPISVIEQIAQCEVILSSSLHGLIVADSFNVPNKHIIVSDKLKGDGFKFRDYYSSFGIEYSPADLNKDNVPNISEIKNDYTLSFDDIELKKKELISSFPFKND